MTQYLADCPDETRAVFSRKGFAAAAYARWFAEAPRPATVPKRPHEVKPWQQCQLGESKSAWQGWPAFMQDLPPRTNEAVGAEVAAHVDEAPADEAASPSAKHVPAAAASVSPYSV